MIVADIGTVVALSTPPCSVPTFEWGECEAMSWYWRTHVGRLGFVPTSCVICMYSYDAQGYQ